MAKGKGIPIEKTTQNKIELGLKLDSFVLIGRDYTWIINEEFFCSDALFFG